MYATITLKYADSQDVTIIIKRQGAFKMVVVPQSDLRRAVATAIVNLTNMGYTVFDKTEL